MRSLCVYCGSNTGCDPAFRAGATALGEVLAERGITLIYGGARCGLMGVLADTVLRRGGRVVGIIPEKLRAATAHPELSELIVVETMSQRKQLFLERADGVLALPGGIGTGEELLEAFTLLQLGYHHKPCGVLNTAGFYDGLLRYLDDMVAQGFMHADHRAMLQVAAEPAALLQRMADFRWREVGKWWN